MTAADAQAFRAEPIEEGKRIDPQICDIIKYYVEAVDLYGIFEVPDEWRVSAASCSHATCPMGTGCGLATCRKKRVRFIMFCMRMAHGPPTRLFQQDPSPGEIRGHAREGINHQRDQRASSIWSPPTESTG